MASDASAHLELRDYLQILRRRKATVALVALVAVAAALAVSFLQTPVYEATAKLLVRPSVSEQVVASPEANTAGDAQRGVDNEIQILRSPTVEDAVAEELGSSPDVSISGLAETDVIQIKCRDTDAAEAAECANTYADVYIEQRQQQRVDELLDAAERVDDRIADLDGRAAALQAELAEVEASLAAGPDEPLVVLRRDAIVDELDSINNQRLFASEQADRLDLTAQVSQRGGPQVIADAGVPSDPVEPKPLRNGLLALAAGLAAGLALAFLREYLDDTVTTKEDLERASGGLTVVGMIPAVAGWRDRRSPQLISVSQPRGAAAEAYRTLRTSVQFLGLERPIRSLQVTSASPVEGKTTTLANLAVTMSRAGRRVVVLCCDLRRPRVHEFFELSNRVGLTSVLLGESSIAGALQVADEDGRVALMASGPPPPNPAELLASPRTTEILESLAAQCDLVLLDSPPVLPVTDAIVLAGLVDATLLVAASGTTTRRGFHRAVELLQQVDAPLVGTVLNGVPTSVGYGATYGYGEPYAQPAPAPSGNGEPSRRRPPRRTRPETTT